MARSNSREVRDGRLQISGTGVDSRTFPGEVEFLDVPELKFDYVVTVAISEEPVPMALVSEVTIRQRPGGEPITGRAVASELGRVRLAAISRNTVTIWDARDERTEHYSSPGASPAEMATQRAAKGVSVGRRPLELADYERVALVYREAQAAGRPTGAAVAAALRCKPSKARRAISHARNELGLLPATTTTRPRLE